MYSFEWSNKFLSDSEKEIFKDFLSFYNVDDSVWKVFDCLFRSGVKGTIPMLLKVYEGSILCGAAVIIKCSRYGRSMFNNKILSGILNLIGMPFYLWIKFGCCMDMMSNPGFVREPDKADEIYSAIAHFLKTNSFLTMITDYSEKAYLYPEATILPSLPHALIDTSQMSTINDYLSKHKNIKHKINIFKNNGGQFYIIETVLNEKEIAAVRKCFISTAENSIFYLPYEDLYLNSALITSSTHIKNVYYFITRLNGEFLGYQAAIKTGNCLIALHGAFDRERTTTYHAYALLFVEMTRFAIENKLKLIDFGAVLNVTKQRMVNVTKPMSYFMFSKSSLLRRIFYELTRISKIQGNEQMRFYREDRPQIS